MRGWPRRRTGRTPASRTFIARSSGVRCSTPHARAGNGSPTIVGVVDQPPVGADDAVEAVALAQQAGDDRLVEAEADLLVLGADGHAVVRHDLARAGLEGGLERLQVVARTGRPGRPARGRTAKCGSSPSFCGPPPGKCLVMRGDRCRAERRALEAADVGRAKRDGQLGVLAEGRRSARPAGLGGEVDLRVQRHADADRHVLLPGDVAELARPAPRRR